MEVLLCHILPLLTLFSLFCAAVKKPAPAPPKPGNPPPGHPGGQSSPGTGTSPKPSTRSPSPPSQQAQGMRRCSSSLPPIQAPNHPPPQPPTQPRLGEQGPEPGPTPPQTPTPPSTPPLAKQNPSHSETTQPHGTLPRPRPVPKPRNRPSVPPPPHPPGAHAGDGSLVPAAPTASRIVTGEYQGMQGSLRLLLMTVIPKPGASHICWERSHTCSIKPFVAVFVPRQQR